MNDLCFFRSLARHVQAHECEFRHDPRGLEEFWAFLERNFHDFHSRETLKRCWDVTTGERNACILEASRKNDYKLPHGFKDVQAISAPIGCDSDAEEDPVARVLDYKGIHPTLPSSLPRLIKEVPRSLRFDDGDNNLLTMVLFLGLSLL